MKILTYLQGLRLLWIVNLALNTASFINLISKSAYKTSLTSLLIMAICLYYIYWCTEHITKDEDK